MNRLFFLILFLIFSFSKSYSAETNSKKDILTVPDFYQSVNVIDGEFVDSSIDLSLPGPARLEFKRWSASPQILGETHAKGWVILPIDLFNGGEEKPKESVHSTYKMVYDYDPKGNLTGIKTQSLDGSQTYNGFNILTNSNTKLELEALSGQKLSYEFKPELDKTKLLTKVKAPGKPEVTYTYQENPFERRKMISSRSEKGRTTQIEYDWFSDFTKGKVKSLKSPGPDGKMMTTARFVYKEGETEVYDALNRKTVYRYSPEKFLTSIESQNPEGSSNSYRTIRFYWNKGKIASKTLEDGNRQIVQCETFQYDSKGRLAKQTLWGNLSGKSREAFSVDANGQPSAGVESYSKSFQFSEGDEGQLILSSEDNGIEVRYHYDEKSKLLDSQLTVYEGKIIKREFYEFDGSGNLLRTTVDDGHSESIQDLSGVTERRITEIVAYGAHPNSNLPQVVEERYVDVDSGEEKLLKKMVNTFSKEGWLLTQEAFDGNGIVRQRIENEYDSQGQLLSRKDLDGKNTTYAYDDKGNPSRRSSFDDKMDTQFYYDFNDNLIRQDELTTDGSLRSVLFRYDLLGNKTLSTDSFGNETEFTYDALNRLKSTTMPAVMDANGHVVRYKIENSYDVFDRVIKTLGPEDKVTETRYNVRGKPIEIRHPDGTVEKWIYNLDGSVKESTDRKGMTTQYTYDGLGNTIETVVKTESGIEVQRIQSQYSGFRMRSSKDSQGKAVEYHYDGAGRLILEISGESKVEYEFDALGQCTVKREWFGSSENDYRATVTERDDENNVKRVYIQDSSGNILIVRSTDDDKEVAFGETEGHTVNELGQTVLKTTTIDLQGIATEITYDALNRIDNMVKKDPFGAVVAQVSYRYDSNGNTCKEIHTVFSQDSQDRHFVIAKTWSSSNQLLQVTEGEGSSTQKITRYAYNPKGQLLEILKPDGKSITQEYNELGELVELRASDNSFAYHYSYDSTGNIVTAKDLIHNLVTQRRYDERHQLISETLGTGLRSSWSYDNLGRLTEAILPDNSSTSYRYDAANLREITRRLKDKTWTHQYTYDNERGRVVEANLMANSGSLTLSYDSAGRPIELKTKYWAQSLGQTGRDKMGRMTQSAIQDPLGKSHNSYAYDPLSRLVEEKGTTQASYSYDSLDNRLSKNGQKVVLDHLNQLLSNGSAKFTYDDNGNVISEKREGQLERKYTYDPFNRLTKLAIGNEIYEYIYDPFNRRISKQHGTINPSSNEITITESENYLYFGDLEIGAASKEGKITQLRTLGVGLGAETGAAVLMELYGKEYVPIHDMQGSVRALIDAETHKVAEFYRYTAFGEVTIFDAAGQELDESAVGNAWLFSSKRFDSESGFYFFGKRYYAADLGRWFTPDPLGFADGPNLYAYVHQNPLNANDLYGLFSFSELWNSIKEFFLKCFEKIKSFFEMIGSWMKTYLSAERLKDYFKFIGYEIIGKGFAILKGGTDFQSYQGIYGNGELNDKVRVTFINGIYTQPRHVIANVKGISETHGGVNVHYVYSATRGIILDLIRAARIKFGFTSPEAHLLADTWRQMIAEMGGLDAGGKIIHYAHSIGAGDTERALGLLTQEERQMIEISTFGAPILMEGDYKDTQVTNYVNVRDGISLLDPLRYFKALFEGDRSIIFVGSMNGFPFIDHLFGTAVYRRVYETLGKYFVQLYT